MSGEKRQFAGAFLLNDQGEVLLQLRDQDPSIDNPGKVSVFGGSVEVGETYREGLLRELKEELDLTIDVHQLRFLGTISKTENDVTTDCEFYFAEVGRFSSYTVQEGLGLVLPLSNSHLDPRLTPTCLAMVRELQFKQDYALATGKSDTQRLNALASVYGDDSRTFVRNVIHDLSPQTIVEFGCGHGHMALYFASLFPQAHIFAVDASIEQLNAAHENQARSNVENVSFLHTSETERLPLEVDIIFSRFVIIHQQDENAYLDTLKSFCSDKTIVVLIEPVLSGMIAVPHVDAVYLANQLTIELGQSKGIDYGLGQRAIEAITARFKIDEMKVFQPVLRSPTHKSIIARSFDHISEELVRRSLCTAETAAQVSQQLHNFVENPDMACAGMQIVHLAGRLKGR
ncbi:CmcI family methyltransferase [Ochrobactrum sp. BTU1]|uniref:CmcI family methyltransferase n=1 Tax=Ochrobactrum sp. BTU1 TaxID=2840456 RepID=UPI001C0441DB|nr:methyltransferase domain-containing protein [Ochrobactrum sp. BTU1]